MSRVISAAREYRPHAWLQQRRVATVRIGGTVTVRERQGTLAETFEDDGIEITSLHELHGRIEAIRGEAGAGAQSIDAGACHDDLASEAVAIIAAL